MSEQDKGKDRVWLEPPRGRVQKMMVRLARAYDAYHADQPGRGGAEIAIRSGNGIAVPYWEYMARAALNKDSSHDQ